MNPYFYFLGRFLQITGLIVVTYAVILFFTKTQMTPLLIGSLAGAVSFYGGTWLLEKNE